MENFAKFKNELLSESAWEQEICSKKSSKYLNPRSVAVGTLFMCTGQVLDTTYEITEEHRSES